MGYPPPGDQHIYDRLERDYFSEARAAYGADRWGEAETAGARMSYDEAIDYALAEASDASRPDPAP